ncbi:hypothetical protein BWI96_12145 [Siphonobacter sp. SORGH_AS_0500]|uniref:polysaccharide pyruvyl transferase family protein n=1 Tax=Siphonobacter sp. SORGH_AS_0500 TaxID=1864824 RepID=UPI000CAC35B7|nr:polysaccharide pyruvyl transferase family protein [Siphonobacter sp. SORGH_AS_0500]PKK36161.1 hypothetical protein BWI96_12145 [Siphonobacter sp. SORGH_AS_0500]
MGKLKVFWWKHVDNFGDALNPYLVEKVGTKKVQYFSLTPTDEAIKDIAKSILRFKKLNEHALVSFTSFGHRMLVIGSVISKSNSNTTVWGAGFMNENETCKGGKFYAVRGKETIRKLKELGFKDDPAIGDPALLLPLIYKPKVTKKVKLGIIPHWTEVESFRTRYAAKYKLIDLVTKDIEGVVDQIASCDYILSTSLHGVIVAHAYGIPAIWVKEGYIHTDGFKFNDYFSSINIPYYDGFNIEEILNNHTIEEFFEIHKNIATANINLFELQKSLLKAAPFELKEEFKKIVATKEVKI